jgi:hypothetical protein
MTFLDKISFKINDVEVAIYRNVDVKTLASEKMAREYVAILMNNNDFLAGTKVVVILWENDGIKMADCWVFGKNESETAGAEVSVYLFKDLKRYESPTVSAADGLIVLGVEAKELLNH